MWGLLQGSDVPLVTFDVTRSYANNLTAATTGGQAPAGNHGNQVGLMVYMLWLSWASAAATRGRQARGLHAV